MILSSLTSFVRTVNNLSGKSIVVRECNKGGTVFYAAVCSFAPYLPLKEIFMASK